MAQSYLTRRRLAVALGSQSAADAICTIIDNQTGTVSQDSDQRIKNAIGTVEGAVLSTKLAAGTALTDPVEGKLTQVLGTTATKEITAAQSA